MLQVTLGHAPHSKDKSLGRSKERASVKAFSWVSVAVVVWTSSLRRDQAIYTLCVNVGRTPDGLNDLSKLQWTD